MAAVLRGLERRCRLCAQHHDAGVMIFGERGHRMMLGDSIRTYLNVDVSLNDRLPKTVCLKCCSQIDSIRIFAEMAHQSQVTLSKHLEIYDIASTNNVNISKVRVCNTNVNDETDADDDKSDSKDCSRSDREDDDDDDNDVTEMEVRLDPMLFLDSHSEDSQTNDSKSYCDDAEVMHDEDRATLTKIEKRSESLTIQLVKFTNETSSTAKEKKGKTLPDLKPIKTSRKYEGGENVRPYTCTYCPRGFYSNIALLNHMWLHSNRDAVTDVVQKEKVTCPICRKDMSSKKTLKVHMESHRPKGKYCCDICDRVFKTNSNLYRHKQYHGSDIYTCKVCGRVYPTNSTLRAHSVTHSDARPHNCPLCKKTFKRNQDLKFHINQHTGARPYHCPYCPKAFASSGNCFSHRKRMHPMEVERDREKSTLSDS